MTPALRERIIGLPIRETLLLDQLVQAYGAGREAARCKARGLPFEALVLQWTNFTIEPEVQRQFYRGVVDGPESRP